jgi:hypothetical protein
MSSGIHTPGRSLAIFSIVIVTVAATLLATAVLAPVAWIFIR